MGILRLRIPSEHAHRPEIDTKTALVRELHVYGFQVPVGKKSSTEWQHRGWGSRLLRTAEEIARYEFGCRSIYILSGVGVREYYRRHGYRRLGATPYMFKELNGV